MLNRDKLEISQVWGKLEIKFPVRTKETDAIMVLIYIYNEKEKELNKQFLTSGDINESCYFIIP